MHIQLTFENLNQEQKEILIARLSDYCEGFEEEATSLKAIVAAENFDEELKELFATIDLKPQVEKIEEQNWNRLWESNFEPVVVDDFVAVRADFHQAISNVEHVIIITPKMSFGTGHHATTFLMIQVMREIDFKNKSVFDFGTGTGILSILSKKLGAGNIMATDIDSWSVENAAENFERNHVADIFLKQSGSEIQGNHFDIILANINKNVLMATVPQLAKQLKKDGILLLSGLLEPDEKDIIGLCTGSSLKVEKFCSKKGWIALKFNKL